MRYVSHDRHRVGSGRVSATGAAVIRVRRRVAESELAVARIRQQIEECLATISADDDDIEL